MYVQYHTESRQIIFRDRTAPARGSARHRVETVLTDLAQHAAIVLTPLDAARAPDPGYRLLWNLLGARADLVLWGYKHWTRLAQLRVLVAYFQSIGISDLDALRVWATKADFNRDFRGRVKGLGPAVFQWLVMRAGVETVKPDVHVMSFVFSAIGYKPSFDTVISSLETIARSLGRRPRELDLSIWETQRGGPGRV